MSPAPVPVPAPAPAPSLRTVGNGQSGDASYVPRLEAQLRVLSETVRALESQLAGYAKRNQELEESHMRLASYRAQTERTVAQRAADTIREAEARAQQVTAAAEARATRLQEESRAQAMDLIEAVGAEIDALEQHALQVRADLATDDAAADGAEKVPQKPTLTVVSSAPDADDEAEAAEAAEKAAAAAAESEAELERARSQISDLLKLREAILLNIRGAVAGFEQQLDQLEQPPLADETTGDGTEVPAAAPEAAIAAAASGPAIELEATPVDGVLDASRIEQELAATGAVAHLRSVEGRSAMLEVQGIAPAELTPALAARFPGSTAAWDGDGHVRLTFAPAQAPAKAPIPEADEPDAKGA